MKKFLIMAGLALAAAMSHGYALWWDVDVGSNDDLKFAYLVAVNDSDPSKMFVGGGYEVGSDGKLADGEAFDELGNMNSFDGSTWGTAGDPPTDWSGYSFHVLFTDNQNNQVFATNWTGRDETVFPSAMSWADLVSGGFTTAGDLIQPWSVVPEPSCALLFGLGAALVAIRRRRR